MENRPLMTTPKGWKSKTVEQVFDFYPTATYSRDKQVSQNTDTSIKYIHYGDIHTKYNILLDASNPLIPQIEGELKKDFELVKDGDLIIADTSEDYDGVGKCVEVVNVGDNQIISGLHTLMLRQKGDDFIDGFKGYFFSGEQVRNSLLRIVTGIKVYSITKTTLAKVNLLIPSHQEQKAFVSILSKVDEAIASVQNSIAAAERLKKSLIQNLLTGKMKPDGTFRTPEEFYIDEKFGKVPVGWEVKKIREIAENLDNYRKPIKAGDRNKIKGKYPYYGAAGIVDYINDYLFDGTYILFGEDGENLISRKVPQAFIVKGKFWVNNHAHILRVYDGFDINLIVQILESKKYDSIIYGSAQPKINKSDLCKIKIIIPIKVEEQKEISDSIIIIDKEVTKKQNKITTLERLKKSLMQNLLTGKVQLI